MIEYLDSNFQPWWVQCVAVGLFVGLGGGFLAWVWVLFWEWHEKRMIRIFNHVISINIPVIPPMNIQSDCPPWRELSTKEKSNLEKLGNHLKKDYVPLHLRPRKQKT